MALCALDRRPWRRPDRGARVLQAGLAASVLALSCSSRPPPVTASPPAQPSASPSALAGSGSCKTCHERFYGLWSTSFHGLAMQPWGPAVAAVVPATTAPLKIGDREYAVEVSPERGALVERTAAGEQRFTIAQALGGKNVFYFLTPLDRGLLQTLPVAWDWS